MSDRDLQILRRAWRRDPTPVNAMHYITALERAHDGTFDDTEPDWHAPTGECIPEGDHETIGSWYARARTVGGPNGTPVAEYLAWLLAHSFDYGTICHAVAASALAGAYAVEHSDKGGITGFQSGFVMWSFVRKWLYLDGPLSLVKHSDMLYPQYADKFEQQTISKDTWAWLQAEALRRLTETGGTASASVTEHWQAIIDGEVPFGWTVA